MELLNSLMTSASKWIKIACITLILAAGGYAQAQGTWTPGATEFLDDAVANYRYQINSTKDTLFLWPKTEGWVLTEANITNMSVAERANMATAEAGSVVLVLDNSAGRPAFGGLAADNPLASCPWMKALVCSYDLGTLAANALEYDSNLVEINLPKTALPGKVLENSFKSSAATQPAMASFNIKLTKVTCGGMAFDASWVDQSANPVVYAWCNTTGMKANLKDLTLTQATTIDPAKIKQLAFLEKLSAPELTTMSATETYTYSTGSQPSVVSVLTHLHLPKVTTFPTKTVTFTPSLIELDLSAITTEITGDNFHATGSTASTTTTNANLKTLKLGTTQLGDYALAGMAALDSLVLPGGITKLGAYALEGTKLKHLTLGNLTAIGAGAFASFAMPAECKDLELPASVASIGDLAFATTTGLESITIKNTSAMVTLAAASAFAAASATPLRVTVPASQHSKYLADDVWKAANTAEAGGNSQIILISDAGTKVTFTQPRNNNGVVMGTLAATYLPAGADAEATPISINSGDAVPFGASVSFTLAPANCYSLKTGAIGDFYLKNAEGNKTAMTDEGTFTAADNTAEPATLATLVIVAGAEPIDLSCDMAGTNYSISHTTAYLDATGTITTTPSIIMDTPVYTAKPINGSTELTYTPTDADDNHNTGTWDAEGFCGQTIIFTAAPEAYNTGFEIEKWEITIDDGEPTVFTGNNAAVQHALTGNMTVTITWKEKAFQLDAPIIRVEGETGDGGNVVTVKDAEESTEITDFPAFIPYGAGFDDGFTFEVTPNVSDGYAFKQMELPAAQKQAFIEAAVNSFMKTGDVETEAEARTTAESYLGSALIDPAGYGAFPTGVAYTPTFVFVKGTLYEATAIESSLDYSSADPDAMLAIGDVFVNDISYTAPYTPGIDPIGRFAEGGAVQLRAEPSPCYEFVKWTITEEGGTAADFGEGKPTFTYTMPAKDVKIVAVFQPKELTINLDVKPADSAPKPTITTTINEGDILICDGLGTPPSNSVSSLAIKAGEPASDCYVFSHFEDNEGNTLATLSGTTLTYALAGDNTVFAVYKPAQITLAISTVTGGSVAIVKVNDVPVSAAPAAIACGSKVVLKATPQAGYKLTELTYAGAVLSLIPGEVDLYEITLQAGANQAIVPVFAQSSSYVLTWRANNDNGTVVVMAGGQNRPSPYTAPKTGLVTFTPSPKAGAEFSEWRITKNGSVVRSTANPLEITPDADMFIVCLFRSAVSAGSSEIVTLPPPAKTETDGTPVYDALVSNTSVAVDASKVSADVINPSRQGTVRITLFAYDANKTDYRGEEVYKTEIKVASMQADWKHTLGVSFWGNGRGLLVTSVYDYNNNLLTEETTMLKVENVPLPMVTITPGLPPVDDEEEDEDEE